MKQIKILLTSLIALCTTISSFAQNPVTVGGAPMYPTKNIIENAMNSKDHTTLVAAVKAAGLVEPWKVRDRLPFSLQQTRLLRCCLPVR
jgi:uncharacterized surface protein with fasciclin (FAS1) repeats